MKRASCLLAAALFLAPAFLAPALLAPAGARAADDSAPSDQVFAEMAAHGNLMEIALGKLAAEKAQDSQIRNFAERMVEDHAEAQEQLKDAAGKQGVELPRELDQKARQAVDRLSGLSGNEFDREYMKLMVEAHQKDVPLYEEQSQDPDSLIQAYAGDLRPILRKHREIAEKLAKQEVQLQ